MALYKFVISTPDTPTPVATEDRLFEQVQESTFNKSCKELKITSLEDADLRERKTGSMEKLHLKLHESPRKHKEGMEEIELQEMNAQSVSDETEQLQESTLTESCKGPKTTTLEDSLPDSWELVEAPAEPEKLQESSPEIRQSVSQALNVSYREEKPEDPVVSISKQLIKQTVTSSRFYSSEGDNNGYLMELKFSCESTKSHRTKVNIYIFIQAGKNDSQLMWPLRTTVQLLFIDLGGDTYHVAEISGTWEKPGTFCKDELDIAYEELIPDNKGMLKLQVRLLDC